MSEFDETNECAWCGKEITETEITCSEECQVALEQSARRLMRSNLKKVQKKALICG